MLRTQAQKQRGVYVCSLCRRAHQQHTAQIHAAGRAPPHDYSASSRPLSSSSTHTSRSSSSWPLVSHVEGLPKVRREGKRNYSTWGKFGSNTVPGQSNAAWAAGVKKNQDQFADATKPAPWGGAQARGTIAPAKGTSAWGSKLENGLLSSAHLASDSFAKTTLPTRPAISPASSAWQPTSRQSTRTGERTGGISAPSSQMPSGSAGVQFQQPAKSISQPSFVGSIGAKPLKSAEPWKVVAPSSTQSSSQPTNLGGTRWPSSSGNSTFGSAFIPFSGKPGSGSRIASIEPKGGPSTIPSAKPTGSLAGLSLDDLRQAAVSRDSHLLKPTQKAQPQTSKFVPLTPRSSTQLSSSIPPPINESQQVQRKQPPPLPPPAEFPSLRRKASKKDLFESMSPFNLPRQNAPPSRSPTAFKPLQNTSTAASQSSEDAFKRMQQSIVSETKKKIVSFAQDDWDSPSETQPRNLSQPNRNNELQSVNPRNQPLETSDPTNRNARSFGQDHWASSEPGQTARGREGAGSSEQTATSAEKDRGIRRNLDEAPRDRDQEKYPDERRRRGRDSDRRRDRDWEFEEDFDDRRRKPGKSKKSKNQRQQEYGDDYDGDYDFEQAMALREERARAKEEKKAAKEAVVQKKILLPEYISVSDLANALRIKPRMFLSDLEQLGFENIVQDSVMTGETAALVAAEYGFETTVDTGDGRDLKPRPPPEDPFALPPRPPIVTIMGHVDHGKTTMLDWLRKSSVAAQEHGGITQHIGAFSVKLKSGKLITFLDTPGHAAFLSMRQRGANVTDIVILVVAVDDSVKPQTIEAIKHAQNAKVPMIVAINKIDIDDDPRRIDAVKTDLASNGVEIEDYGGDVQVVAVSGVTGRGMGDLEESILTLSEILDMRAETDGMAEGWVLEASVKTDGRAATILVKRGTLRIGDLIVAGKTYTRIRTMRNAAGTDVREAGPSTPVEIYGSWKQPPMAGDMVLQAPDETKAQAAVDYRQEIAERAESAAQQAQKELADREEAERKALEEEMQNEIADGDEDAEAKAKSTGPIIYNVIVKGDVMGSVEALTDAIKEIGNNEIQTRVLRASPGLITESDIDHMAMAQGCIVNFNTVVPSTILRRADDAGVKILDYNIIYEMVDALKLQMSQLLEPIVRQKVLAEAEVLQVFPINIVKRKYKNIAGVKIRNGIVTRGGQYRIMRTGESIHEGKLEALKQNKKDVTEMRNGTECGMMFEDYDDFQPGDIIQLFENIEERRYL